MSIPVICDRCRQSGTAGKGDFSHLGDLLEFEPVPVKPRVNGWDPDAQRAFIALLSATGSKRQSAKALQRNEHGITQILKRKDAGGFILAYERALAIARQGGAVKIAKGIADVAARNAHLKLPAGLATLEPGQALNERGEPEDEASLRNRAEDARDSMSAKVLRCRRLFLMSIATQPVKRAAFEILTELAIDWDKAKRLEAQADEPWRKPNAHNPDLLLTAENGWMGELLHGPDKKAELLEVLNKWRVKKGLDPFETYEGTDE
jgi:hypothetical protein